MGPGEIPTPAHVHGESEEIFFVLAGSGLTWMDDNRKAESRWLDTVDLGKGPSFIGGDEDSVVVLHPHAVRRSRALHQAMDILGDRVMRQLRWHVLGAHSLPTLSPARTGILGEPDASR